MLAGGLGSGGLLFLAAIRPYVFGQDMMEFHGRTIRSLDEINLHRLAFFITWPGFGIMWSGFCVALYKHRKQLAALLLFPGVLLFPIYLWHARVSARLMWWGRRFIPVVLTVVVVLIAVALAEGMIYRGKMKVAVNSVALASTLLLIAAFGQMSWPLRSHAEYGGSYEIVDRIAAAAGDEDGVFLWEFPDDHKRAAYLFGGPLWFTSGQVSALLEQQPNQRYVETFMEGFPGRRLFVVAEGNTLPDGLSDGDFTRVDEFSQSLTVWEETTHERPSRPTVSDFHISVWELTG
jgi:hypothetical protein